MVLGTEFENLHQILRNAYDEMMPLCADMADVARVIAGIGALFYISLKVWQALARAEPVDVYPLLRPFALGLCIMFFPLVLQAINGILSPVVVGTSTILEKQTFSVAEYRAQKDKLEYEAMVRDPETAYIVSNEVFDKELEDLGWSPKDLLTMAGMYMEREMYKFRKSVRDGIQAILEFLFQAAALVIDTIRTFFLVVLAVLGPIVFALATFDGLQASLTNWFTKYISIYLWLPVCDLFSALLSRIQVLMIKQDIAALEDPTFIPDASSGVYIIFMLIGIMGYFLVPTVADWIVKSGGAGTYQKHLNDNVNKGAALAGSITGKTLK
jgi:conjugative transposon TraJ protein